MSPKSAKTAAALVGSLVAFLLLLSMMPQLSGASPAAPGLPESAHGSLSGQRAAPASASTTVAASAPARAGASGAVGNPQQFNPRPFLSPRAQSQVGARSLSTPVAASAAPSPAPATAAPRAATPGVFWNNTQVSEIPAANVSFQTLYGASVNSSSGVFLNRSAYDPNLVVESFNTFDNNSDHCPQTGDYVSGSPSTYNQTPNDFMHAGYEVSTDGGATWGGTHLLYDGTCGTLYPNSWFPQLLWGPGNVLYAFVEGFNITTPQNPYNITSTGGWNTNWYSELVFLSSTDDGQTWSKPTVLAANNVNTAWVTTFGDSIYVAWDNTSMFQQYTYFGTVYPYTSVEVAYSGDQGASWTTGAPIDLTSGLTYLPGIDVESNGQVDVIYDAENFTTYTTSINLVSSTDNGTSWTTPVVVASPVFNPDADWIWGGPNSITWPQITYDPSTGNLYAVWDASTIVPWGGFSYYLGDNTWFAMSTTAGTTWSTPTVISPTLSVWGYQIIPGFYVPVTDRYMDPSVGVGPYGLAVTWTYGNSTNAVYSYGFGTQTFWQQVVYSDNNGTTWSSPYQVNNYVGANAFYIGLGYYNTVTYGLNGVDVGYTNSSATYSGNAEFASPTPPPGTTVDFVTSGLPAGTSWWVNLMGNNVTSSAASLAISGAPQGVLLSFNATTEAYISSTVRASLSPTSTSSPVWIAPGVTSYTVWLNYTLQYEVQSFASPTEAGAVFPTPSVWVASLSTVVLFETPDPGFAFAYWQGTGIGAYTGTNANPTVLVVAPITETAEFIIDQTYNVTFQETGLPSTVTWKVTTGGTTYKSNLPWQNLSLPSGTVDFTLPWLAGAAPNTWWIGVSSPSSPITVPSVPLVTIAYTLVNASAWLRYGVNLVPEGLPAGTLWQATFNGTLLGGTGTISAGLLPAGTYELTLSTFTRGSSLTEYVPTVSSIPIVVTDAWVNQTVTFQTEVWFAASASPGGTITSSNSNGWVLNGTAVQLTATASAGYYFSGWVGTGAGSYTGSSATATATLAGPVTEVAQFTASPQYNNHTSYNNATYPKDVYNNASSSSGGLVGNVGVDAALAVVGLVVGVLVGFLLFRRKSSPPSVTKEPSGGSSSSKPSSDEPTSDDDVVEERPA